MNINSPTPAPPTATLPPLATFTPRFTATPIPTASPRPTFTETPSPSPIPPTPSNTPTPSPTPPVIGQISTVQDAVRLREGPAVTYPILEGVPNNTEVIVLAANEDQTWFNVRLQDGTEGWVFANLVYLPPTATPIPTNTQPGVVVEVSGTPLATALIGGQPITATPSFTPSLAAAGRDAPAAHAAHTGDDHGDAQRLAHAQPRRADSDGDARHARNADDHAHGRRRGPPNPGRERPARPAWLRRPGLLQPVQRGPAAAGRGLHRGYLLGLGGRHRGLRPPAYGQRDLRGASGWASCWTTGGCTPGSIDQQADGNWAIYWYVPITEPLARGFHTVTYRVTWRNAIFDGYEQFGPGTATEEDTGDCTFEIR